MSFSPLSLKGLNALTKVAEAGSINGAARLLGVTPSAVSHLIADVEAQVSAKLVDRDGRSATLTKIGRSLCKELAPAFEQIAEAVRRVRDQRTELKISMVSTFALNWLIPRLPRFQCAFPDINVAISTTTRTVDLDIDGVDAAVRYGLGDWPQIEKQLIFREVLVAVAAPSLVGQRPDIKQNVMLPRIAARHRLNDWSTWNKVAAVQWPSNSTGTLVETRALAIGAAIAGSGVLIIDAALVSGELATGRLVQVSETSVPCEEGYWIVWSKARSQKPAMRRFKQWLVGEGHGGQSVEVGPRTSPR
jgi:LysR family glycine cleavage system transcriptional activator